jgi:hypothetical protein
VAAEAKMLAVTWRIAMQILDIPALISKIQDAQKQEPSGPVRSWGPFFTSVQITGASWDGSYYYIEIQYTLVDPGTFKAYFLIPALFLQITDSTVVTVEIEKATSAQTFTVAESNMVHKATLKLDRPQTRFRVNISAGGYASGSYFEISPEMWAMIERRAKLVTATALASKEETLYEKATQELNALKALWDEWHGDSRPTCELANEIRTHMSLYNQAAAAWEDAYKQLRDFVAANLADLMPPATRVSLPEVLPFEQWPPRRKLKETLEALASQAENIAQSIATDVADLMTKAEATEAQIEATKSAAVADMIEARRRGAPEEEINKIRDAAKAKIKSYIASFTLEARRVQNLIKTARNQIADIGKRIDYLTCSETEETKYLYPPKLEVTPPPARPPSSTGGVTPA